MRTLPGASRVCGGDGARTSRSRHHRNAARVLPLPVGAWMSVCRPVEIDAQPPTCAGGGRLERGFEPGANGRRERGKRVNWRRGCRRRGLALRRRRRTPPGCAGGRGHGAGILLPRLRFRSNVRTSAGAGGRTAPGIDFDAARCALASAHLDATSAPTTMTSLPKRMGDRRLPDDRRSRGIVRASTPIVGWVLAIGLPLSSSSNLSVLARTTIRDCRRRSSRARTYSRSCTIVALDPGDRGLGSSVRGPRDRPRRRPVVRGRGPGDSTPVSCSATSGRACISLLLMRLFVGFAVSLEARLHKLFPTGKPRRRRLAAMAGPRCCGYSDQRDRLSRDRLAAPRSRSSGTCDFLNLLLANDVFTSGSAWPGPSSSEIAVGARPHLRPRPGRRVLRRDHEHRRSCSRARPRRTLCCSR